MCPPNTQTSLHKSVAALAVLELPALQQVTHTNTSKGRKVIVRYLGPLFHDIPE